MLVNYVRAHFTERIFTDIVSTLTLIWFDVNTYSLKHRWDHIGCQYFFANTNIAPYCVLWKSTVVQVILQVHRYSLYPTLLFCTMYWHPCYISFSMDLLKKNNNKVLWKKLHANYRLQTFSESGRPFTVWNGSCVSILPPAVQLWASSTITPLLFETTKYMQGFI